MDNSYELDLLLGATLYRDSNKKNQKEIKITD